MNYCQAGIFAPCCRGVESESAFIRPNQRLGRDLIERKGIAEEEALKKRMEEKSKEFAEKGSELYAKA